MLIIHLQVTAAVEENIHSNLINILSTFLPIVVGTWTMTRLNMFGYAEIFMYVLSSRNSYSVVFFFSSMYLRKLYMWCVCNYVYGSLLKCTYCVHTTRRFRLVIVFFLIICKSFARSFAKYMHRKISITFEAVLREWQICIVACDAFDVLNGFYLE